MSSSTRQLLKSKPARLKPLLPGAHLRTGLVGIGVVHALCSEAAARDLLTLLLRESGRLGVRGVDVDATESPSSVGVRGTRWSPWVIAAHAQRSCGGEDMEGWGDGRRALNSVEILEAAWCTL
mmetsp:Transcript_25232/g.58784  ORF Transcript_25232/g.58784 Transcript_25232/m.58784 type:complete len:123 (+) Transcript_25232:108-476(+)